MVLHFLKSNKMWDFHDFLNGAVNVEEEDHHDHQGCEQRGRNTPEIDQCFLIIIPLS